MSGFLKCFQDGQKQCTEYVLIIREYVTLECYSMDVTEDNSHFEIVLMDVTDSGPDSRK